MNGPSDNPVIICAENVALLSLLHSVSSSGPVQAVPAPPSSNTMDHQPPGKADYFLPFDKERSLVGILAFLAQTEDDANHIPALCVEQAIGSLKVLIAVNKSKWTDGDSILHGLKQRFDKIFSILAKASGKESSTIEGALFASIINMCSLRILQRLYLLKVKRKPRKPKKPIKETLQNVMECVKRIGAEQMADWTDLQSTMSLFRTRAKEVVRLIDLWRGNPTPTRLGDLVKGINHLHRVRELGHLLELIPTCDLQQDAKVSLLNIIAKVARYQEAAKILCRIARKFPIARQMAAVAVKLPEEAFGFASAGTYIPNILSTLTRIAPQYHKRTDLNRVYHLLDCTEAEASGLFSEQVHRTLRESKIHAEMQLVTYCELQRPRLFPRIICSSKDACFLCNSFLLLYNKIRMPRCHGRLYPGWRLPSLPQVKELEQRFNKGLEDLIKKSLSRQQKKTYPFPNESTLHTIPVSETTECSSAQPTLDGVPSERSSQPVMKTNDAAHESNEAIIHQFALSRGAVLHGCIDPERKSPVYVAGSIKIGIEYMAGLKSIKYSMEWLTCEDMESLRGSLHQSLFINAESLAGEVSIRNQRSICIMAKGSVLRFSWEPKVD